MAREDFNIVGRRKLRLFPLDSPSTSPTISSTTDNVGLGSLLSVTTKANRSGDEISQTSNDVEIVSPPLASTSASTVYHSQMQSDRARTINDPNLSSFNSGFDEQLEPGIGAYYHQDFVEFQNGDAPDYLKPEIVAAYDADFPNMIMTFPDNGGYRNEISTNIENCWRDFNVDAWVEQQETNIPAGEGGTFLNLPVLITEEFVNMVRSHIDRYGLTLSENPITLGSLERISFCFDWERGVHTTLRRGSMHWFDDNEDDTNFYKQAYIELRRQQALIYDACKAQFPQIFFGTYGGTVDLGQSEILWNDTTKRIDKNIPRSGPIPNTGEVRKKIRWFGLLTEEDLLDRYQLAAGTAEEIIAEIERNYLASVTEVNIPWDYVSRTCFDPFAPNSRELFEEFRFAPGIDKTGLNPNILERTNDFCFSVLQTAFPDIPVLGFISPSNIARFSLGHDSEDTFINTEKHHYWADKTTWVDQQLQMIKNADGYVMSDDLRADQYRQLTINFSDWQHVIDLSATPGQPDFVARYNDWWLVIKDLHERFGILDELKDEFNLSSIPTSAEEWFNLPRGASATFPNEVNNIRNTYFTRNLLARDIQIDLRDNLIPLAEEWRKTKIVPFTTPDQIITGTLNVGETLTIGTAVGNYDRDNVDYAWSLATDATIIGTESTLVIPENALNTTVKCNITYRRDGDPLQSVESETDVILPAGSSIVDFGQWELTVQDQAIFTKEPTQEPIRIGLSAGQQTFSIGFAGSLLSDIEVQVGNKVIFTVNGVETDPTTIESIVQNQSPTSVTINLSSTGDFATAIATGAIGEKISFTVEIPEPEPVSSIFNDFGNDTIGQWELAVQDQAIFTTKPTEGPIVTPLMSVGKQTFSIGLAGSVLSDIEVQEGDEVIFTVNGVVTTPTTIDSIVEIPSPIGVTINLSNISDFLDKIVTGAIGEEISIVVETPEPVSVSRITDDVPDANGFVGIWELSVQDQAIFTDVPPADPITFTFSFGMSTFQISLVGSVLSDISVEVGDEVIFTVDGDVTSPTTIESIDHQIVNGTDVVSIVLNNISNFLGEILSGAIGEEISVVVQPPPPLIAGTLTHPAPTFFSSLALEPSGWSTFTDNPFPQQASAASNNGIQPTIFVVNIPNEDVADTSPTIKSSIDTDSLFNFTIKNVNGEDLPTIKAKPSFIDNNAVRFDNVNLITALMNTNNIEVTSITFT
tara:strand:+ start:682 stop:4296 length:3615 start_codon:yes stop_codon:yes gene_type:complete